MLKSRIRLMLLMLFCLGGMVASGQTKETVTGIIRDSTGAVLPGVSVMVKGTSIGTTTDPEGRFRIQALPKDILMLSAVGYSRQEVTVGSQINFNISLRPSGNNMEEAVVTSMGIRKDPRSLGYAISSISAKDITESGNTNFASALYGKAAGVRITTAPGGATSAVNVQIRGVSSFGLNTQPLYVVDGVPIRLYDDLFGISGNQSNNQGYYGNQRIQSNGILDINPDDIENITILKGASASALYGSEATNGVVVITTKKGNKSRGMGIDFNYVVNQEKLETSPTFQNTYGPGYDEQTNVAYVGSTPDGWLDSATSTIHPFWGAQYNFGPKFDGRQVQYWDGSYRPYVAYPNNYKEFFQTGYNSSANVAFSNGSDKGNYRFSYTRMDYKGILPGVSLNKNNFNFNGTLKMSDKVSLDLVSTYNNNFTHNRPYLMSQIFASYNGMFTRADDMKTYFAKYQTTDGYQYVLPTNNSYDQDQKLTYAPSAPNLMNYLFTTLRNNYNETQNRFINSLTLNIQLLKDLKLRGRLGEDYTTWSIIEQDYNTEPAVVGPSGYYGITANTYNIFYGDALAIYSPKLTRDLNLSLTGGFTARKQLYRFQNTNTGGNNGLEDENFFSLSNSTGQLTATGYYMEQVDVAGFGTADLNYKNWLYIEGTGRYESTSTLPPTDNHYFYPSVNAGFILSDVVKLPDFFNYAKVRASYGLVGNHPTLYAANVGYTQNALTYGSTGSSLLYTNAASSNFGNNGIQSEEKRESEVGLETRMLNDRVGLDLSYYNNKVSKQILTLNTPASVGATSVLGNAGDLMNYGVEAAINALAYSSKNVRWSTRFNFAINRNKLLSLPAGQTNLVASSQDGGYAIIRADVGGPLGNIYVHPTQTDGKGNAVITNGLYNPNTSTYQYVGNILPKVVGGWSNSVSYKRFSLDFTIDYRFGGKLLSIPTYYMEGTGMYKSTLKYRDAAHGGLAYDVVSDASASYTADPNGARHDGLILKGVTPSGATNTQVITAAMYYENTFDWESNGLYQNAVFNNSYIKFREATFTYNLPAGLTSKMHFQGLSVSLIGRNLFYIYKTLPDHLDPEVAVGSAWYSQGIDGGSAPPTRSYGLSVHARF